MQPDEIVLSFRDPAAIEALHAFADLTDDDDLAVAIVKRLDAISGENLKVMGQGTIKQRATDNCPSISQTETEIYY